MLCKVQALKMNNMIVSSATRRWFTICVPWPLKLTSSLMLIYNKKSKDDKKSLMKEADLQTNLTKTNLTYLRKRKEMHWCKHFLWQWKRAWNLSIDFYLLTMMTDRLDGINSTTPVSMTCSSERMACLNNCGRVKVSINAKLMLKVMNFRVIQLYSISLNKLMNSRLSLNKLNWWPLLSVARKVMISSLTSNSWWKRIWVCSDSSNSSNSLFYVFGKFNKLWSNRTKIAKFSLMKI